MSVLPAFEPFDALRAELELQTVSAGQVAEGAPRTGHRALTAVGTARIGVWEMTAGVMRDIEVDEVFIVIDGAATVTLFQQAETKTIRLGPGSVCRLSAGMSTRWEVARVLRKIYIEGDPAEVLP